MLLIDKYAYTNKLRKFNPQAKFLIACGGLFLFRIININILYALNILVMAFLVVGLAGIPFRKYLSMFSIPFLFLIMSLIMILISVNDSNYLLSLKIFNTRLGVTSFSIYRCMELFLTVMSSLASIYFFILTTPMNQIIKGLKRLRVPDLFIELMILIYRSIFIFLDEMHNMDLAQRLKFGYENKSNTLKSLSLLISNLFRKIIVKHKEMSIALECKLYDGEFKIGD